MRQKKLLPPVDVDQVNNLRSQIQKLLSRATPLTSNEEQRLRHLEEETMSLVAAENVLYSSAFISSISKPFLPEDDNEELSWKL